MIETIQGYLQSNINIYEQLSGIFIYSDSNVSYKAKSEGKTHQLYSNLTEYNACLQAYSTALYAYDIQKQLANVFVGTVHIATSMWSMIEEGFRCKVYKLNELSSRLMQPNVLKSITMQSTKSKCQNKPLPSNSRVDTFVNEMPPYSFYVEAKISCYHKIKLILSQVIETRIAYNATEKSTIPIDETSVNLDDIYESIFQNIWCSITERTISFFSFCESHTADTALCNEH